MGKGIRTDLQAKVFIEATGDGDLGFLAGAVYEKSKPASMIHPPTVMFFLLRFDEEKFFNFWKIIPPIWNL